MSIAALAASTVIGLCSLNNAPPERCHMVYEVSEGLATVGWVTSSNGQMIVSGPVNRPDGFEIAAIKFNQGAIYQMSGQCILQTKTVRCAFSVGGRPQTFTFVSPQ